MMRQIGTALKSLWQGLRTGYARMFSRSQGPASLEKIRTGTGTVLQLLTYHDGATDETTEIREEYRKMLRDDAVKASLLAKVDKVSALDWQVHPPRQQVERDREVADWCDWSCERMEGGKPGLIHAILFHGLIEGNSVGEKVWDLDPVPDGWKWAGRMKIKAVKPKDPRICRPAVDGYRNIVAVQGLGFNSGRWFDPKDFVIFSHLPLWDNPQGMSDLRAAYRYYWVKDTVWKLRAIYLEKFSAGGVARGRYKRNEQRTALVAALEELKGGTYVALPDGTDVDLLELATRGTADFEAAIRDLDKGIVVSITGAFLQSLEGSTSQGRGSSAIHKGTSDLAAWRLAVAAAFVISTQLFPDLVSVNYHGAEPPWLTLGAVDDADLAPAMAVDKGLWEMGLTLSRKELYERYGRSEPNDEADAVKKPEGAPPGGPSGGGLPFAEPKVNGTHAAAGVAAPAVFRRG